MYTKLLTTINNKLGSGFTAEITDIKKNNNVQKVGVVIRKSGYNISPVYYLTDEDLNSEEHVRNLANDIIRKYIESSAVEFTSLNDIQDFTKMYDKIKYVIINYDKNVDNRLVYRFVGDLAYGYVIDLLGDMSALIPITKDMLDLWTKNGSIGTETLHGNADLNTTEYLYQNISDRSLLSYVLADDNESSEDPRIITTNNMTYGFSVFGSPVNRHNLYRKYGECYVIPSSIHEAILMPKKLYDNPNDLRNMLIDINSTVVDDIDILSDNLYQLVYDSEYDLVDLEIV